MSRSAWLRVGDMVDAAKMAVAWTEGLDRAAFLSDDLRKSGVQWQLLVLGEAAKAVPADIQALEPSFNWRGAIRLRDFLAHGYSDIDAEALWEIATQELPRDLQVLTGLWNRLDRPDAWAVLPQPPAPKGEPEHKPQPSRRVARLERAVEDLNTWQADWVAADTEKLGGHQRLRFKKALADLKAQVAALEGALG